MSGKNRFFGVPHPVMWCALILFLAAGLPAARAVTVDWRDPESTNGDWDGGGSGCTAAGSYDSQWWYAGWGGDSSRNRPDCFGNQQINFNNNRFTTMTLNGSSWFNANTITFASGASTARTMGGSQGIDLRDSGAKIDNDSTATHVLNVPIAFNVNPVQFRVDSGDLTFNGNLFFKGNWMDIYGGAGKNLSLHGVLKRDGGDGGIAVKEDVIVSITNNNDASASDGITGAYWIERGVIRLAGSTNAPGASGIINIGTNASLQLNENVTWRPSRINIYGIGTNGVGGLRKITSTGSMTWPGVVNFTNTAGVGVEGGELILSGIVTGTSQATKVGPGLLILTNNGNGFTGTLIISNGTVQAAVSNALGSVQTTSPGVQVANGGTLALMGTAFSHETIQINGLGYTNGGALSKDGSASAVFPGQVNLTADARVQVNAGSLETRGLFYPSNNTLYIRTVGDLTMGSGSAISNLTRVSGDGALYKDGAGTLVFKVTQGATGSITLAAGQTRIGNSIPDSSYRLPRGGHILMLGGTTFSSDFADRTVDKNFTITGGVGLALSGTGILTLNGDISLGGADRVITNADSLILNGIITNGGYIKAGAGTLTISSNNTYAGQTLVSAGVLLHPGTNTASAFGVAAAGYLYGNGSLGGLTPTGMVSAGSASNNIGNLRVSSMTMPNSGRMRVDLQNMGGAAGTDWDLITVSGGSGTYNANATAGGNEFVIYLKGSGNPAHFNNSSGYTNIIIDAGTASGFAANEFTVNTDEFGYSLGGGSFSVDADSGNLRLIFTPALVSAPDVVVLGNNIAIPDADTTPQYSDNTDFGDALVSGGTVSKTFTITNSGSATLGLGNVYTNAGGNGSEFIVTAQPAASVAVNGTTTFTVQFNPTNSGLRFADLEFTNNVSGAKNPYTFRVQGTGTYVEVAVRVGSTPIADGDATPSAAEGTDFGNVGTAGATSNITYTITNSGNRAMSLGNVTTSGTHAADFIVTAQPSATLQPSNSTTFTVQFNPSANGLRSASLSFTTTDDNFSDGLTENPFNFDVQGTGAGTGISNFPTTLSFSSTLGSLPSPSFQSFSVSNVGLGTLTYTLATNVTWLRLSNEVFTAAAGAGNIHTAHVQLVSGMATGTSNATITITGTDGFTTNSPKVISVSWTISAIPDPSAQSATASGAEHVALRWTKNASYDVMIVHRAGAASTAPSQGTAYSVGGSVGGGTVIYKGAGAYLDHVVSAGTTNYYAFYSYNGNYYSAGVTAAGTTTVYQAGEIVEPFAYTNGTGISGLNGGQGWTSSWSYVGGTINVVTDRFTSISGYPSLAGNAITSASPEIYRGFAPVNAGKLYVAFMMRTDDGGNTKYSGLSFFDGAEEKFIGEGFSQINQLTVGSAAGRQLANNTDYTIIAMYDFENDVAKALLYTNATESVPSVEPGTWHVEEADATIGAIRRIRLAGNTGTRWDEIRVATSWEDLLLLAPTYEWDAGGGAGSRDWSTAANWTRNTEPGAGNSAFINGSYTGVVSAAGERAGELFVGSTNMPSHGVNRTGTLQVVAGDLVVSTNLYLGRWSGARGTLLITNGTLSVSNALFVGDHGRGFMTITNTASVWVGRDLSVGNSSGVAEDNGSTLTIGGGTVYVGDELRLAGTAGSGAGADGTLFMYGGVLQVTNQVLVGDHDSSTGVFNMVAGRLAALGELVIIDSGSGVGVFRQSGGTADVAGIVRVGDNTSSDAQLVVTGGVFNAANAVQIGDNAGARGSLVVSGGVFNVTNHLEIGQTGSGTGVFTMAEGNANLRGNLRVGNSGIGTFNLTGGAITAATLRVSEASTSTGTITVSGGRLIVTNSGTSSAVFDNPGSLFTQSGGLVEVGGFEVGDVAGSLGSIRLNGGTLLVGRNNGGTEDLQLGNVANATGVVQIAGGFLDLNRSGIDLRLGDASTSAGFLTLASGTATVGNVIYVGSGASSFGSVIVTSGVLEAGSDLLLASGSASTGRVVQLGGRVAAGGNIELTSTTGNNSYYEIQGGTLTNGGNLTVGRTDALGTGVFHVVGGSSIIHVGDSTTEDFRIQNSGELRITFSGSAISPIQVSDDINLSSGSTLSISNIGGIADGEYLIATSRNASAVVGTFTTTNWLGSYTGTISYTGGCIRITFVTPSEIAVLGTNLAVITSGDVTPGAADGTDFGSVAVVGATLDRTFYVTNSGGGNLTLSGVTTSGTDAARFTVLSWPTIVSPLSVSNLVVRFDPAAVGLATAVFSIANNDSDENPYTFGVQGFGVSPAITTFPTTLNFSSVLGTAPASQTFSITNHGLGSMTYSLATNATWLTALPAAATVAAGAGQVHTATVSVLAGQQTGTSNATITVTSGDATNSPKTISVSWTITAIPDPTAQTATADGREMARLAWTKNASYNVMIVHKGSNAPSVPANGTTYSLGHTFADGSRVIAFNSGASALEHIVAPGSTNFYAFYSMNNSFYSPGVSAGVTTLVYQAGEIVEQFGYTNGVGLQALNGGQGWTNTWTISVPRTNTDAVVDAVNFTTFQSFWPTEYGNRLLLATTSSFTYAAFRGFPAVSTGSIYVAALYRREFNEGADGKFSGISFMNGSTEIAFVGEPGGSGNDDRFGVDSGGSPVTSGGNDSFPAATDYLLIGRYDFASGTMQGIYYTSAQSVPSAEPTYLATVSGTPAAQINGIRLASGASSGWNGQTYFDEVRVAQSWAELLRLTQPVATNYSINGGANVTDGQIVGGNYSVVFDFYDTAGITNTASLPNFDIWNATGTRILTNQTFASKVAISGGATMRASNTSHSGAAGAAVVLGVYTSRWTAANSNGVQVSNSDSLSNGTKTVFTVVDDDTAAPTTFNIHSPEIAVSRSMHITTNGVGRAPDGGTSPNVRYSLTDGYLAGQISGGAPLLFYFGARDAGSGLQRGTGSATTNSSLTIGSAIVSNVTQWDVTRSSAFTNTYDTSATNVWSWITPFTATEIDNLVTNTANGYGTNLVTLTWRDADFDRSGDQSTSFDQQHGFLVVVDDDLAAPVITNNFRAFGRALNGGTFTNDEFVAGFSVTGSVGDAFSGLFAGASNTLVVKYQDGTTVTSGIWSTTFANGGNGALSNTFVHGHLSTPGVYTMAVTVVDYDIDRPNDSLSTTSNFVFTVVNAPTIPGLAVGPLTLNYSAMLGSDPAGSATFNVTNVGQSGTLLYTNYQVYGTGASGWFSVNPTNNSLAVGSSRVHTGWVGSASISSIGTYYATNRVDGNQTNAAQLIQVILTVTNIPNPTSVTATRDGAEMIRLAAAEAAGRTVLVVFAQSNAPSAAPVNGTGYNVGDTLGNGRVVFAFKGSGSVSNLEHVVPIGSTNFYALYTVNNNRYSTGLVVGATSSVYRAGELVDQFGYTNGVTLGSLNGGQGWTNAWRVIGPNTNVDTVVDSGNFLTFQDYWPSEAGNRFVLKTTNSDTYAAFRGIAPVTSGKIYVAALYRREFNEGLTDGKFSGLRFMGHTIADVVAFVGERGTSGNDDIFGVSTSVGGGSGNTYGSNDSFPAGTDYLIIGRYDFDTDIMAGIYYTSAQSVPDAEPTFFVETTNSAITEIRGISMVAGAASGWNGAVHFDELRVATNWSDLLLRDRLPPYATNYLVNGGSDVTDAQVTSGVYGVRVHLRSQAGVESTNTTGQFFQPHFDLLTPTGTAILTDRVFSAFSYVDSQTLLASNASHAGAAPAAVVLGIYTMRWSAVSSNGNASLNVSTLSNGTAQAFTVVDDDTAGPEVVNIVSTNVNGGSSRLLHIAVDGTNLASNGSSSNNIAYSTTDSFLTNLSSAKPLLFWLGARDASGLNRGNSGAATNSHLSIGSAIISNVTQYDMTRSSPFDQTSASRATNVWSWITPFTSTELENLVTNTTAVGSNAVIMTWVDADMDRANDAASLTSYTQGWFVVSDDDAAGPTLAGFNIFGAEGSYTVRVDELTSGTGWSITGLVSDASGVNVNGTETNLPDNSPFFELWDAAGNLKLRKSFAALAFADGGATSPSAVSNGPVALTGVAVGTWTARVIVADADEDFGNRDHAFTTSVIPFKVTSGVALGGIGRGPASLIVTSYFGSVSGVTPWPNFYVTNIGSGTLTYSNTITYGSAGGWLSVAPTEGSLTGNGVSQVHTAAVNAASLNPGTYTATITINGDQTNSAQTIAVTLNVFGFYVGEIVDQFTNTPAATSLHNLTGGTGWSSAWSNNPAVGFSIDSGSHTVPGNYPSAAGNKVCGSTTTEIQAYRNFPAFSTGKVFVAATIQKTANNNNGFAGVSFFNGSQEVGFVGKLFGQEWFGIDNTNGTKASSFGFYQSQYFIVGMYDFSSDVMFALARNSGDTLPLTQPSTWEAVSTNYVINQITGIRIAGKEVGTLCFDEIRVATSWEGMLNLFTNEPTVHAVGMSFRDVTTNAMVVGWTPGNGANRIVVAREGAAVTFSPTDAVAYAFSTDFSVGTDLGGGNKVIYNGSGTNVNLTGLGTATQYFFRVFEYNGAGSTANYYTNAGFLTGSRWTLSIEPANQPTLFAAYQQSSSAISNTWTAAAGSPSPDGYLIFRQLGAVPTNVPTDGLAYTNGQVLGTGTVAVVVTPSSVETVSHSGLVDCRPYYFTIFSFRQLTGQNETLNYLTSGALTSTASTACGEPSIQASNIVFSLVATNSMTVSWQNGNGEYRLVVARGTNAVNADPVDTVSYASNATYGSGAHLGNGNYVVYSGTGTSVNVQGLLAGVTYHFRVYEFNGTGGGANYNTNTAVNNPRSSATASFSLVDDKFVWNYFGSYANNNLNTAGTGSGWTNNWTTFGGYVAVDDANMPAFKGYPADTRSGCGISCDDSRQLKISTVAGTAYGAYRNFPPRTGGQLYGAIKFNVSSLPSSAFFGVSFLNGTAETGFVGKAWGITDARLTIEHNGVQSVIPTHSTNTYTIGTGTGNDYILFFEYDFDEKVMRARAYTTNQLPHALPELELGWAVEMTNVNISRIDGIRIAGQNVGDLYFDHIRLGPSWEQVVWDLPLNWHQDNGPVPTLVYVGTNYGPTYYGQEITNLSDAELRDAGKIDFAVRWSSPTYGIFLTNNVVTNLNIGSQDARVSPNWDPLAVSNLVGGGGATNQFNLDRFFTNFFGRSGDSVVTSYQYNAFNITNINFEDQYFITVSAETYHDGSAVVTAPNGATWNDVPVNRAITINEPLRFYVYDDDTNQPVVGSSRPLRVMTNGVLASSQDASGLDRYRVIDGMITQLGMQVSANIYDAYSGLQRSTSGSAATNLNITVEHFVTNNADAWSASLSSTLTTNSTSTSVWSFAASAFTWSTVSALWGGDGTASEGQDLNVLVNAPDADDDRLNDFLWRSNELVGYIRVVDDDQAVPFATNTAYGGVSGSRLFAVTTNSTPATLLDRAGVGLDVVYNLTDDELVNANTRNLRFAFGAIDQGSGLSRGTSGTTNSTMSFSLFSTNGAVLVANNMSHYDAGQSSAAGPGVIATSVWSFTGSHIFNETLVNNMMTNGLAPATYVNTNLVQLSAVDADNDRTNDAAYAHNLPVGQITVRDDDRLAPNVGGMTVMGSAGIVVPTDLYISEYVEGSSNNKYIEIFNGTGGSINLADYAVGVYFNGNLHFTGVNNPAFMSGTLGNGGTYIIANDDAVIWGGTPDQIEGSVGNFNGNDAIVLVKKVGLVTNIIDTLGVIGENVNWLSDVTAVRRGSVTGPSSTWVSNDWAYLSIDVLGGLGGHSAADPVTDGDLAAGGVVVLTGTVQDVTSGIYAQTGDARAPRRSLKSNTGFTLLADGEFSHKPSSNGDAKTPEPLWENALGAVGTNDITLGVYTAVVSAVDYDIDRPSFGDNLTNRFPVSFLVVDDDTAGPTAATNVTSTHVGWTNALNVTVRWSTNSVVDPSGVSLWRVSTNVPDSVTNGSLLGAGSVTQGTYTLTVADEGVKTNELWAVDADGDRPLDQTYGAATQFITRLDVTAPLAMVNVSNDTTDANVDETEELKVAWTALADEATASGKRGDGTALSPWSSYIVTYHEIDGIGQELNTGVVTSANGPANLAVWNTTSMIISNLDFDSSYRIRIAGRDQAGNIGPETVITGETIRFVVTQGLARVESTFATSNQVDVYWLASTNKVYDVLYVDSPSLRDNLTNSWKLLSTVTNSWMYDNGGTGPDGDIRIGPALNQHTIRFYRVSRKDVWRTNVSPRRASVEIYAAKSVRLVPGENWISLFAIPDTSTVAYVLGTNRLVGGSGLYDSPKISWFGSSLGGTTNQSGIATSVIYFASSGNWLYWTGGVGNANNKLMPQNQAFLLELPVGAPTQQMVLIGLVPTQEVVQAIAGGSNASNNIHILSFSFPQRTRVMDAGFFGSGMVGNSARPNLADEVRILRNRNGIGSFEQPRARMYLNTAGTSFQYYSGSPSTNHLDYPDFTLPGSADYFYIEPDDAVIIVRRNAGTMYWTNRPSYTAPGKNVNP